MKKKSRMLAAMLCAVLMVGVLTAPAYAGGGDEGEGSEYVPWVGLEPVDPLPVEQPPDPKPFTPDGTGTVLDNATDEDGKEFFTITTADEAVFYLVIDRQREAENVYFLNAVTVADLMALAEPGPEPEAPPPVTEPEPEPTPTPEPEPQKSGGPGCSWRPWRCWPWARGRVVLQNLPSQAAKGRRSRRRTIPAMTSPTTTTTRPLGRGRGERGRGRVNFTDSPYEPFMKQPTYHRPPEPTPPPQGVHLRGVPLLAGPAVRDLFPGLPAGAGAGPGEGR